jgi:endonuclease-3 related protein
VREKSLILNDFYSALYNHYGEQKWWPGNSRFEVIVGAILTQNTNWRNVEKAIKNLKQAKLLTPKAMHAAKVSELAILIRPAGYFNVKAQRLKNFLDTLFASFGGSLTKLFNNDAATLREVLLSVNGIGPETADSIILYAAGKPAFVVDAYTKRILSRHGLAHEGSTYHELQLLFTKNIAPEVQLFNEYHALIVMTGKDFCKTDLPLCAKCPLERFL